ncbi:alanyl-tRNA editing protein [Paenibacillus urinalis]|uniref:DHHA1 domain-containing protein n=1 Tax=Paenibacillus urinalis TaxID=521520 RepID=A0AAX3N850_9BACL|nr:DHHA1 domain-containing protein [Paenibacillus urinalis]WDH84892.1 DHHA1 domain-containing protein [Paenibacillus urinalis]
MTKKLYYDSAYTTQWETRIIDAWQQDDSCYVQLEETAFYPHGGGQPCDIGTIQGIPVLDVTADGDQIIHKVQSLPESSEVSCRIDWDVRFDHMQQHSAQHLLSAVCLELYKCPTISFHLGVDYCTIDVESAELSRDQINEMEQEANRHIYLNHPILSYWVTEEEAAGIKLVKQPTVKENIRIVEMRDVEYNACGGTHVSSTGEIGIIKLLKTEKQKGNTRIYFTAGYRALKEFNLYGQIVSTLSSRFKAGKEELVERLMNLEKEQKQLQTELAALRAQNDEHLAHQMISDATEILISHIFEDKTLKDLQGLANKLTSMTSKPVLLATAAENKVVLSQNKEAAPSCGKFFKEHLADFKGKGGGSDVMAQAGFDSWEDAAAFFEFTSQYLIDQKEP